MQTQSVRCSCENILDEGRIVLKNSPTAGWSQILQKKFQTMGISAAPRGPSSLSENSYPLFRGLQLQQIVFQHNRRIPDLLCACELIFAKSRKRTPRQDHAAEEDIRCNH